MEVGQLCFLDMKIEYVQKKKYNSIYNDITYRNPAYLIVTKIRGNIYELANVYSKPVKYSIKIIIANKQYWLCATQLYNLPVQYIEFYDYNYKISKRLYGEIMKINIKSTGLNNNKKQIIKESEYNYINEQNNKKEAEIQNVLKKKNNLLIEEIVLLNESYSKIEMLEGKNLTFKIQLLHDSGNHIRKSHCTKDGAIRVAYQNGKNSFTIIKIAIHYCCECDIYFDYYESFIVQLKNNGIDIELLFLDFVDYRKEPLNNVGGIELSNRSILHKLGYVVGEKGLKTEDRIAIINLCLKLKFKSLLDIKSLLAYQIRLHENRKNFSKAVNDWKSDLNYINSLLINLTQNIKQKI